MCLYCEVYFCDDAWMSIDVTVSFYQQYSQNLDLWLIQIFISQRYCFQVWTFKENICDNLSALLAQTLLPGLFKYKGSRDIICFMCHFDQMNSHKSFGWYGLPQGDNFGPVLYVTWNHGVLIIWYKVTCKCCVLAMELNMTYVTSAKEM